jgi:hypothetical protein
MLKQPRTTDRTRKRPEEPTSRYLTDGGRLYRVLGWLANDDLMALEDCSSLAVILVEPARLRRLIGVEPASAPE